MHHPKVHLYTICWNEAAMLGYFFRHHDPWVDRYVFFDDGSTDGTLNILARHPRVEVRRFERSVAGSYVLSAQQVQNACWKESRGAADWVIFTAVDEHLHHPSLPGYLRRCHAAGVTLVPALGYQMVAEDFPPPGVHLATTLRHGAPFGVMSKLSLFRPDKLAETNFGVGRHSAAPTGELRLPQRDELLLLHYKYLGRSYTRARQAMLGTGLGEIDRSNNWGVQYFHDATAFEAEFAGFAAAALDTGTPALHAWDSHDHPRWWQGLDRVLLAPEPRLGWRRLFGWC